MNLEFFGSCTLEQAGCTTCGDKVVPVKVLELSEHRAVVEDRTGQQTSVALDFVPDATLGDVLFVHMGVALAKATGYQSGLAERFQ